MSFEAIVYPAREVPPVPFIAHRNINTRADVFDKRARVEGTYLGQKGDLCVYFPSSPSFPDVTSNGEGIHLMVSHGPNRFASFGQMSLADRSNAAEIALYAANEGYIVGSDHGKRPSSHAGIQTHPIWNMFNMQFVNKSFPRPTLFQHAWETPDTLLWEPSAKLLRRATQNFLGMFDHLNVLEDTHFGDYRIHNGAVAELQKDMSPSNFAGVLENIDTQLLSLWNRLNRKYGNVYQRVSHEEPESKPCDAYAASLTRHKGIVGRGKYTIPPCYSWTLFKHRDDLMLAVSPHIRSGGGFLETLGIVPVRTPTPGYSHKPALERARKAFAELAPRWGATEQANQRRGTFTC